VSKFTFTMRQAFAASAALHSAVIAPFALNVAAPPPEDDDMLVLDLRGLQTDVQLDEQIKRQTSGAAGVSADLQKTAIAQNESPANDATPNEEDGSAPTKPRKAAPKAKNAAGEPGPTDVNGAEQLQKAQKIHDPAPDQLDPLKVYAKILSKRVQSKLVYPEEGRQAGLQGVTTVSFTIMSDGSLRPESLKVVNSSGHPKLDESALKTIRACFPFEPPPKEITLSLAVTYGRKR